MNEHPQQLKLCRYALRLTRGFAVAVEQLCGLVPEHADDFRRVLDAWVAIAARELAKAVVG
jgi:hypothetical protein